MTSEEMHTLEAWIDRYSLTNVLSTIREICLSKVDHLRTNWRDEYQAKEWENNAKLIERANKDIVF